VLTPGASVGYDIVTSGAVQNRLVLELVQGTRTEVLFEQRGEHNRVSDLDPRIFHYTPSITITPALLARFEAGPATLADLFSGRSQLIVYHFMFDPKWDNGCPGCTSYVSALGDLSLLNDRDTTFVLVSRAPLPKLEAYKAQKGWSVPWFSSFGSDFNYDFHVTNDEKVAPIEYNYRNKAELEARNGPNAMEGEEHGLSVFFILDDDVFHTYSVYARGNETLTDARNLLDTTPYGRQQDFEDSPSGWPQKPTYG
jgi:predicted dithiol-disulfide oxidoreductase (DUF899 family)